MTDHARGRPPYSNYSLTTDQRERIARLNALLAPHLEDSIATLIDLMHNAKRCATQERAASRILTLYADTSGVLERDLQGFGQQPNHIIMIDASEVPSIKAKTAELYSKKLAEKKQLGS